MKGIFCANVRRLCRKKRRHFHEKQPSCGCILLRSNFSGVFVLLKVFVVSSVASEPFWQENQRQREVGRWQQHCIMYRTPNSVTKVWGFFSLFFYFIFFFFARTSLSLTLWQKAFSQPNGII